MNFQIYYSADGLDKGEFPLSKKMIEHRFSCLPDEIDKRLSPKGIESKILLTDQKNDKDVEICLDDKGQNLDLLTELADCIRSINIATPGLCFLIRRQ